MSQSHPVSHQTANRRTIALSRPPTTASAAVPPPSFGDTFARVYRRVDELYRGSPGDGLLMVAVLDGDRVDAHLHVPLGAAPEFVIVGRHTECDLRLASDDAVSLRHLFVGVRRAGQELRVRLSDLATGAGFCTENGDSCAALSADGAAFVSVGRYRLFFLPTGALAPLPWGSSAAETWGAIPERVYLDLRTAIRAEASAPRVRLVAPPERRSIATQIIDPPRPLRQARPLPGARGSRAGSLVLAAGNASEQYEVYSADLERGLLVGRYDRCAFGADDDRLSRVHLVLVRHGDELWAIDTASSNGTTARGARVRQVNLRGPTELFLGQAVSLTWRPEPPGATPGPLDASLTDTPLDDLLQASLRTPAR
jgi:hypothetical protein